MKRAISILLAVLTVVLGSFADPQASTAPKTTPAKGTAPKVVYRRLTPQDGLDFKISNVSFSAAANGNGVRTMEMQIGNLLLTSSTGQELQVALASHSVTGGKGANAGGDLRTVDFGVMRVQIPDATSPGVILLVTDNQVRQIKKKMESDSK